MIKYLRMFVLKILGVFLDFEKYYFYLLFIFIELNWVGGGGCVDDRKMKKIFM